MEAFSFSEQDLDALRMSLKLALLTSLTLLPLHTPVALWLSLRRTRMSAVVHGLLSLPLVLPPTVLGFYLLMWLSPQGLVGRMFAALELPAPSFSFTGLWLASLVVTTPFVVQPLYTAFTAVGPRPWEVAATLRCSPLSAFFHVVFPLCRQGYLSAFILAFAHTLGEFGVILMVGGNIEGATQTVSTAIFGHVEALEYPAAHRLSGLLVLFGLALVFAVQRLQSVHEKARLS